MPEEEGIQAILKDRDEFCLDHTVDGSFVPDNTIKGSWRRSGPTDNMK